MNHLKKEPVLLYNALPQLTHLLGGLLASQNQVQLLLHEALRKELLAPTFLFIGTGNKIELWNENWIIK
jgi:hypothetical protein